MSNLEIKYPLKMSKSFTECEILLGGSEIHLSDLDLHAHTGTFRFNLGKQNVRRV